MRVNEMPKEDTPQERMFTHGPAHMALAELLTFALGEDTTDTAERLLYNRTLDEIANPCVNLQENEQDTLLHMRVAAIVEVGRRIVRRARVIGRRIRCPKDVVELLGPEMRDLKAEEFRMLSLDSNMQVIRHHAVTRGIVNSALVHPREVFALAIADRAVSIILVHNHPGGSLTPSYADEEVTQQLVQAGRLLDMPVSDHIIIGPEGFFSFTEGGKL